MVKGHFSLRYDYLRYCTYLDFVIWLTVFGREGDRGCVFIVHNNLREIPLTSLTLLYVSLFQLITNESQPPYSANPQ